jgi:hypothetical protein
MQDPNLQQEDEPTRSSRILVLLFVLLIVLSIAVFLIIRPTPGNSSLPQITSISEC